MTPKNTTNIDPENIVDQLYDIALDPNSLDLFIDAWNAAGLDAQAARQTIKTIDDFDAEYFAHLKRAGTFLERGMDADTGPDLAAMLAPFDDLAAFIVDRTLTVVANNAGAEQVFGMTANLELTELNLSADMTEVLVTTLGGLFTAPDETDRLLKLEVPGDRGTALFQIRALVDTTTKRSEHALIVTTRYHWQAALGQTLEEIFKLTAAEQGVVKAMVEGMDAKAIAAGRGTSEGTVRGQIKSILSKMNARNQSEVIRLVLSLRDVSTGMASPLSAPKDTATSAAGSWVDAQVWKPFETLVLPGGRKMDYHDMGPANGAPIIFTHMGYGAVRWHAPMIALAFRHGLRVIVPIRAGYGYSENLDPKADVLKSTRDDTIALLDHLKIKKLPYVPQGNDFIFAADFAKHHPDRVTEIIGICARPPLPGDRHYAGMSKWHRFFLSTAKHAPHLLNFTIRAAVAMARRLGPIEFLRQAHKTSPADVAMLDDHTLTPVLIANGEMITGKKTNMAQAYVMESLKSEIDWTDIVLSAKATPTRFINGGQDPSSDIATIAEYREAFPWIEIEVIINAGQLLIYQQFETVIPKLATAAHKAQRSDMNHP